MMKAGWIIGAAVFLIPGIFLRFVFTPMRFCGTLLLAAAAGSLLWGWLSARREKRSARVIRRILTACLALGVGIFAVFEVMVISYGHTDRDTEVSAAIVLGAGVNGKIPSLSLRVRLDAALDYVKNKPNIPIVVSGARGPGEEITEARCMADWLIDRGIDEERILLEEKAVNTEENIRFSIDVLRENGIDPTGNIAVVTSDYHLKRAEHYWSIPGMVPVAAHMPREYWYLTVNYYIREAFALAADVLLPWM